MACPLAAMTFPVVCRSSPQRTAEISLRAADLHAYCEWSRGSIIDDRVDAVAALDLRIVLTPFPTKDSLLDDLSNYQIIE